MERKLASIQIVADIQPITGADMIEVATVKSWKLVCKRGEFKVGEKVVYCEIDSFLPVEPTFEFLRKTSFKKMGGREGFRLKTLKLRGQVSQGLLLPIAVLADKMSTTTFGALQVGDDVSEAMDIVKYEPPIPAQLSGTVRGLFPSFLVKTDEERIQNLTEEYAAFRQKGNQFYVTEKLDGTSVTFYHKDGLFSVCSRNLDLLETEDNTLWRLARKLEMETKLRSLGNFALQGECIGESIQGNPYKLHGQSVRIFNAFEIDTHRHLSFEEFGALVNKLGLQTVPILEDSFTLPETIDELISLADGKSTLNPNTDREGIVIRSHDRSVSFKAISNEFLLKEK